MLRISERAVSGNAVTLQLEGRVIGRWVAELKVSCEQFLGNGYRLSLDVGDVTFVDPGGISLLQNLVRRKIALLNCPLFLTEQLKVSEV